MTMNNIQSILNLTQILLSPFENDTKQSDIIYKSLKTVFISNLNNTQEKILQSEIITFQTKSQYQKEQFLTQIIINISKSKLNSALTTLISTNKQKVLDYLTFYINFIYEVNKSDYFSENTFNSSCLLNLLDSYKSFFDIFSSNTISDENTYNYTFIFKFFFNHLILISEHTKPIALESIGKSLMDFFSRFQSIENKELMFFCALNLIKTYFKLKTYRNTKTFFGWIERSEVSFNKLDMMSQINFYFYYGKLMLFEMQIDDSKHYFQLGFGLFESGLNNISSNRLSDSSSILNNNLTYFNKITILEYLLVLSLFTGKVLSSSFLVKYNLTHYSNFLFAYQTGDLLLFDEEIEKLKIRFVELGLFLVVVKLKAYVLRNLIYQIYYMNKDEMEKMKFPILKIDDIYNIYNEYKTYKHSSNNKNNINNCSECEITSQEEMEFSVLSIIHKGLIKGYVHYNKKEIVFSKKNPFPKLDEVFNENKYKII